MTGEEMKLRPIGVVRTSAPSDSIRNARHTSNDIEAVIEVYPEFESALDGLEGCSHIFVVAYFHALRPDQIGPLKVRPKGLMKRGLKLEELPLVGVFATDSPTRPNPIGLTVALLKERKGRRLIVQGLDYFDGTPVLDIKPYQDSYRVDHYSPPKWYTELFPAGNPR